MGPSRPLLLAVAMVTASALAGCLGPQAPPPDAEPVEPADDGSTPPPPSGPNKGPKAAFDWSPAQVVAGQPVEFVDRSTDPDDGVAGRAWEFPDGSTSTLLRVAKNFPTAGRYLVKLTVSDRAGLTDTASKEVTVVSPGSPLAQPPVQGPRPHVVVAVVDTGINPYHQAFRAAQPLGDPASFLDGYPADAIPLALTLDKSYAEARKADEGLWAGAKVGQLYSFPGTRIVGAISFGLSTFGNAAANTMPVLDDDGHGTGTSSRVATAGPDVLLVMVETGAQELDEALAWASAQPWIDVVSVSLGPLANVPVEWPAYQLGALDIATRTAWDTGKLVFAAAGNEPSLSATSYLSGPTWVISVGGVLPEGRGDPATPSRAMDIVSDYSPEVALHDSVDAKAEASGTSFSAPNAAGAVAQALYVLRAQYGSTKGIQEGKLLAAQGTGLLADGLTNQEVRDAMNGVARYWDTTEWQPVVGAPIAPAPWVQMGWGYVDGEDTLALAQALLTGQVPEKPGEAAMYQASVMAARQAMWG